MNPSSLAKVKDIFHIYKTGLGTRAPSTNVSHYELSSNNKDINRDKDHYNSESGSHRVLNQRRSFKFGDENTAQIPATQYQRTDLVQTTDTVNSEHVKDVTKLESDTRDLAENLGLHEIF